ncbi:DUF4082 domain-containing protein [Silvibacterium acidisoli]|uniref:DUF4082 domain-containing protein n=1 Tax=Acidobacteriaceae bacterium ZG23-2 TaxID=2883246 RepID=UPI00406D3CF0
MPSTFKSASNRSYLFAIIALILLAFSYARSAQAQCASPANAIVAENCLTGTDSSQWDVKTGDAGDPTIQGFATDISVNQGSTIYFKINTPASAYTITIYRMGYYGGMGARKITTITPSASLPQQQPACNSDTTTGLYDCGNWAVSASWAVPATATSGIYFAHLIRSDTGGDSHIVFVVRNDSSHSAIFYQTSDETWQAYNYYGGGSLYGPNSPSFDLTSRAYKVSYNRPFYTRNIYPEPDTFVFGAEMPMVEWLEQNGYDVTYTTGVDAARNGQLILNHKIYMDSGHDEYWSAAHRANVQAARDAGVNLAFFSGNEMFWKTRWENSIDGSNTAYRTLVCYKETLAFAQIDPDDPPTWTGTWRDLSFSPPADGGHPENNLTGTLFMVNGPGPDNDANLQIQVPAADGKMRFWRNTAAATLASTATYKMAQGTLGYEWDEDIDNGVRPPGAFQLSTATYPMTSDLLLDYGATYGAGSATHHMMMYRAPSGALVFSSGTVNWSWGLNSNHDNPFGIETPATDTNMQQATVNLFADMGVQPTTLQSNLVAATQSTDTTPPTSVITSPAAGSTVSVGNTINVTGTATDTGGTVGGVEFSSDGGGTWHPAPGRGSWSYAWSPSVTGSITLLSRAVDDSGNIETPHNAVNLTVQPKTCPCTIWTPSAVPGTADSGDAGSVEVGLKFRADSDGTVLGVRFYKAATNTGTHIGHLWSSTGTLLGTATFTGESSSGWQQVNFSSPIQVVANTTYIVSYYAPNGHYSADTSAFATAGVDAPPLHALANGADGSNAVFVYASAGGAFPNVSFRASNYWVDVVYTSSNTYSLSGNISGYGGGGATLQLNGAESLTDIADTSGNYSFDGLVDGTYTVVPSNPGVTFTPSSQSVTINNAVATSVNFTAVVTNPMSISGTITGGAGASVMLDGSVSATTTADASGNYAFNGLLSGSYTVTPILSGTIFTPGTQSVTLSGNNATGVNFQGQQCNCTSIWLPSAAPVLVDSADNTPIEVGVKFRADSAGDVTGLRFYKAVTNTGTHIGHIWSSAGALLGSATFSGETASGWQQVTFDTPIAIAANTTYIASYFAPVGHYSADTNYFATTGVDHAPLHALANGVDGPNGVYLYTSSSGFPSNSYSSSNYWVDVVFTIPPSYTVSGTISGSGGAGATVTLSGSTSATTTADSSGNYTFAGVYSGSYFVTPSNNGSAYLPGSQAVTVSGANVTGVNFTTSPLCPCETIWQPTATPAVIDSTEAPAIEVGTKFDADSDGYILGVRFYKAPTNTGTHIGNLWAAGGSEDLLATANFTGETASGWQQVMFANPVPISANTTYLASYFAPLGHYSYTSSLFASAGVDNPPLHALSNPASSGNGVFTYSSTSTYPSSAFNATGYWVDVIYAKATTFSLGGTITGNGSTGVTVTLTGPANSTTTTNASGSYSFSGLADGTYTVTPTLAGVTFTPASQTVTINGGHALGVNFVSGQPSFTISGTVSGAPNDTVTLSGPSPQTTTTDTSGNYSFTGVVNGNYTVTPDNTGYTVTPASQSVTINGANATGINFSVVPIDYTISGTIAGGGGATVTLSGTATATTTADASGNYTFQLVTNGTYIVTPAMTGRVFVPAATTVVIRGASAANVNFTTPANCPCDTIWTPSAVPTLVDSGDGQAIETGVKFTVDTVGYITGVRFYKAATNTGAHQGSLWGDDGTLLSNATFTGETSSGWQQVIFSSPVPVMPNTTYIASYFSPNGHYSGDQAFFATAGVDSPPLHALMNGVDGTDGVYTYSIQSSFPSSGNNATNFWVDTIFTPASTYSITGTVGGTGGPGATVTLSGASSAQTTANASGGFTFNGLANGTYTVTVTSSSGYTFTPPSQTVTINNSHVLGLSFTSSTQTFTISGVISGTGVANATIQLTGTSTATTTSNASGAYSFSGLASGGYVVTPSSTGATFNPPNQQVMISTANATANFTATALTYTISGLISGAGGPGATVKLSGASTATVTADSTGSYSFNPVPNGSYVVTPTNTGATFTPASQSVTVSGANVALNFSSTSQAFSISGTISGAGGAGATVVLSGASSATTTASASGTYTFNGLANGAYTVTPSNSGFNFTPTSSSVTISGANGTANFSSTAQTFTISGTISGAGGSGATVALSGASSAITTASASGTYTFTGVANGSYTVTPSKSGFSFTPASTAVTISGANGTANFGSTAQTFTISGTISGAGGSGATVALSGASSATTTSSSSGTYTFTGVANGSYTVTPSKSGFSFTPASTAVTISGANGTANFSSTAQTFTISGTISGAGGSGATVALNGASSATTTASSSGTYTFTGVANGSYTVTPSKSGFSFTPTSTAVKISGANGTANFSSAAQTFTISGTISGTGGSGATVRLTGASTATVTASSTGTYSFTGLVNGSYTVTPSRTGFTFSPASRTMTISGANTTANFTATALTFSLSGTISGTGGAGATVRLSGASTATATASSGGTYTFTGLVSGSYTVTPSKTGFTFSPAAAAVTINGANATANFTSTAATFSITGTISGTGGSGTTVRLTGAATATTTASSTGAYSFTGLKNGSYTVTPSKTGSTFSPASRAVTINGANGSANFTATAQTHTISGTITGTGGSGATVRLTGASTATATASSSGAYSFSGLANGSYTVTPSRTGFLFVPSRTSVTVNGANVVANFISIRTLAIGEPISGAAGETAMAMAGAFEGVAGINELSCAYAFADIANSV